MAYYTIGELIRDTRERLHYSQEELCYGICTPSTLSRIENGLQTPGKKTLEGLMQRLGIVDRIYNIYLNRQERERYELEQQLTRCLGNRDFEQAGQLAGAIEAGIRNHPGNSVYLKMEKQYLAFARTLIEKEKGRNAEWVLKELLLAIHMTMPDFDGIHIQSRLLTYHEITILNNIGCTYHNLGRILDGIQLLYSLKEYVELHTLHGDEISSKYPMILQNLSSWLGQEGMHKDALELCQAGIDYCIEYGKLHTFPMLLCNKACALAALEQYDMSKECFSQSIAMFQATNQQDYAEQVKKYAAIHYGIIL